MHSYSPISSNDTSLMISVAIVAPVTMSPFFFHVKLTMFGIPTAIHVMLVLVPMSAMMSLLDDSIYAGAAK